MRNKQEHTQKTKKRYNYNIKNLESAFKSIQEGHLNVRRAALLHGVPIQTLRDRVNGKVKLGAVLSKETLFTHEEEEFLVQHIEKLCSLGYGLSKSRVNILAAELAQKLGRRSNQSKLSNRWYYAFLKRWDSRLKVVKPRSLTSYRAAALTQTTIDDYFSRLEITMLKYNLLGKPHVIYKLDETGLKPEHRPSSVVAPKSSRNVQSVTSPNSTTVTLISCISASGSVIPPFYVFKGKRYNTELLHGALPGFGMSMSDSGWSNSTIFMKYLKDHFLKYVVTRQDPTEHILLLFDGHASHCTWDIMEWAKNNNIILFVLPPHTTHALQPLDVGCFGPFKSVYYNECILYMASTRGQVITKYNIAELSSKAYLKTMTPVNITSGFRKAGVCPLDKSKVPLETKLPSESFSKKTPETTETMESLLKQKLNESAPKLQHPGKNSNNNCGVSEQCDPSTVENLSSYKTNNNCDSVVTKIRRPDFGGKAITESDFMMQMHIYEINKSNKTCKQPQIHRSPKPGPSNYKPVKAARVLTFDDGDELDDIDDLDVSDDLDDVSESDLCCVCKKMSPPGIKECPDLVIVNWAQCDKCSHWTHLRFCSKVRVVRRLSDFVCPHCE